MTLERSSRWLVGFVAIATAVGCGGRRGSPRDGAMPLDGGPDGPVDTGAPDGADAPGDGASQPDAADASTIDGSAGTDASAALDELVAALCAPIARSICASATRCGCDLGGLDEEGCARAIETECAAGLGEAREAIASGLLVTNVEAARRCAAVADALLEACLPLDDAFFERYCIDIVAWSTPIGAPCTRGPIEVTNRCAGGEGICLERCERLPRDGERCLYDVACATGLVCRESGRCGEPLPAGEPCSSNEQCTVPLICVEGACGALRAVGERCSGYKDCAVGLLCVDGSCARGADVCNDAMACGHLRWCEGRSEGRCEPIRAPGEPCSTIEECGREGRCDSDRGVCARLPGAGEPCAFDGFRTCADGAYCDIDTMRCAAAGGLGAGCLFDEMCEPGLGCFIDDGASSGVCDRPRGLGAACTGLRQCEDGLYCDTFDRAGLGGPTCQPPRTIGETCTTHVEGMCGADAVCAITGPPEPFPDPPMDDGTCVALPGLGESCDGLPRCAVGATCVPRIVDGRCRAEICDLVPRPIDPGDPPPMPAPLRGP